MNSTGKTVAKNATILMISQTVTWVISLAMTFVLPRYLGPENIGAMTIAGAIWAIPGVLIAFGTDTLLVKEIARTPERAAELYGTALVLRIVLCAIGWVFVGLYLSIAQTPIDLAVLVFIAGFGQIIGTAVGVGQATIQGLELMRYSSITDIASKAANLVLVLVVLFLGYGVVAVALVGLVTAGISLVVQRYFLRRYVQVRAPTDPRAFINMAKAGQTYLLSGLALTAYSTVDALIISALVDQASVGYYSMAQRLVGTSLFIPTIFITAIFPALSRAYTQDASILSKLARKSFDILLLIAVPSGLGLVAIADPLIVLLYGKAFAPAGSILIVQGISLIFIFLTILLGRLLTSSDRQNIWTVILMIATVITVPLDLILVPYCQRIFGNGAISGAISYVITESAMVVIGIALLPKGTLGLSNAFTAARVIVAGLIMLVVTWQFRDAFILIPIFVGAIVYTSLIIVMRVVPHEDWAVLKDMGQQATGRIRGRLAFAKSG